MSQFDYVEITFKPLRNIFSLNLHNGLYRHISRCVVVSAKFFYVDRALYFNEHFFNGFYFVQ